MALRHDLRADDDVGLARLDRTDDLAHFREARDQVRRKDGAARIGEQLGDFFGDALHARAAGDERAFLAALGARLGDGQREAAVVAVQAMAEAVLDKPGRALWAFEAMAAAAAQRERRVAATVQEQQRLAAAAERLGNRGKEDRRDPAALLRRVLLEVDARDFRQLRAGEAAGQMHMAVAAGARIDVAFDRRRGRGQNNRELAKVGAHDGHITRLIVHAIVLLEAGVVLFVDDDEAEIGVRQVKRGAGADDDACLAGCNTAPGAAALGRREGRVPFDGSAAEAAMEAVEELARQRDLGQHDEGLVALLQRAGDGFEINFRLTRAGHAVEQRSGEVAAVYRRLQRLYGDGLIIGECGDRGGGIGSRVDLLWDRHVYEVAGCDQAIDYARRAGSFLGE